MLITITEYAKLIGKSVKAVEWQLREKNLKYTEKFGMRLIDSRTKWPKRKKH